MEAPRSQTTTKPGGWREVVGGLLCIAAVLLAGLLWFGWSMWDPSYERQQAHLHRARELSEGHQWQDALAEYRAALTFGSDVYAVLGIARCTDRLGDYPGALKAFDRAIAMNRGWYQPYMERAECIERNQGAAAVTAWYQQLEQRENNLETYRYLLGIHNKQFGRPRQALPLLHAALDAIMQRQQVTFTEADQLAPAARIADMEQNDLADLWPDVTEIAECYLAIGDHDRSWRWATRGVSLHQHLCRRQGYCSPEQIEAGSTNCRLLRARIHMDREEWDAAERELKHAQTFDDLWSKNRCDEFARELSQRRAR